MTIRIFSIIAACSLSALLSACRGGNTPATPDQRKELTSVVEAATAHLKESKRYGRLPNPEIPRIGADADFYAADEKELRLVSPAVIATIRNDSAEVLFSISVKKDSASRQDRDALVRLLRHRGKWEGDGAYVVE